MAADPYQRMRRERRNLFGSGRVACSRANHRLTRPGEHCVDGGILCVGRECDNDVPKVKIQPFAGRARFVFVSAPVRRQRGIAGLVVDGERPHFAAQLDRQRRGQLAAFQHSTNQRVPPEFAATAQRLRHDEDRRRDFVLFKNRQRGGQIVDIRIIKRDRDPIAGGGIGAAVGERLKVDGGAVLRQRGHLLVKCLWRDAQPPGIDRLGRDAMIHQDPRARHGPARTAAQRRQRLAREPTHRAISEQGRKRRCHRGSPIGSAYQPPDVAPASEAPFFDAAPARARMPMVTGYSSSKWSSSPVFSSV